MWSDSFKRWCSPPGDLLGKKGLKFPFPVYLLKMNVSFIILRLWVDGCPALP